MQEPSGIYNPLPADGDDEAESRMRALVSYLPAEPRQLAAPRHTPVEPVREAAAAPSTRTSSAVELSQDILQYVQHKVGCLMAW